MLIGGHIDSVPNGGWLDGCLNVMAGVEVMRRLAEEGTPPVTVRLVDWADEEGARFGRSLFGSSAAAGSMDDQDELRQRRDADGVALPDALRAHGVELDRALEAREQLESAAAYLELHIEQGPVLESLDLPLGVVLGTFGVERHQITFRGQAAHAGSTPMDKRRDALAGAAKLELEIREIAQAHRRRRGVHDGRRRHEAGDRHLGGRDGRVPARPAASRREPARARCSSNAEAASRAVRAGGGPRGRVGADLEHRADPVRRGLIELADESVREVAGESHRLPSGPLHDAAEVARAGVPTVMVFVQSLRGLSHTKLEDTKEEHLELSVQALDRLADRTIAAGRRLEEQSATPALFSSFPYNLPFLILSSLLLTIRTTRSSTLSNVCPTIFLLNQFHRPVPRHVTLLLPSVDGSYHPSYPTPPPLFI